MGQNKVLKLLVIALALVVLWLGKRVLFPENVYMTARSPNGKYIAQITWQSVFPYIQGVNGYLVVKNELYDEVFRQELLVNRDHFAEIEAEFTGITWREDSKEVLLVINKNHYEGPTTFRIVRE